MNNVKVVVLDSGINVNDPFYNNKKISLGYHFYLDNQKNVTMDHNVKDVIGHGTAVASLILSSNPAVEIIPIKIIDYEETEEIVLLKALEYIYENIECEIINISLGVVCCEIKKQLENICNLIVKKGIYIVSAFDNGGTYSYPAAFESVIGIDGTNLPGKLNRGYYTVQGCPINYMAVLKEMRVPWSNGTRETVSGTSFLAPLFTAKISNILMEKDVSKDAVKKILDDGATGSLSYDDIQFCKLQYKIEKAVVFPFNKETHSLARFRDLLDFEIIDFLDSIYAGKVGRRICDIENIEDDSTIKDINNLDWNSDFDTLILGHTSYYSFATGIDYEQNLIEKCRQYEKKLYSFKEMDSELLTRQKDRFYCPRVTSVPVNRVPKLHVINCPILAIAGTGPSQGKFSLQLGLIKVLKAKGYKTGQLGTEPSAELFGADITYPMGHESAVHTKGFDSVYYLNHALAEIEKKEPNIIITGSQSHSVPYILGGAKEYPIIQTEFLYGVQADAYILTVSIDVEVEYVKRTISYLESMFGAKVIALAIFPLQRKDRWSTIGRKSFHSIVSELIEYQQMLESIFGRPAVIMDSFIGYERIAEICIDYFSDDNENENLL